MKNIFEILANSRRGNFVFWKQLYLHTVITKALNQYCQAEFPSLYIKLDTKVITVTVNSNKKLISIKITSGSNNLLIHFKQNLETLEQLIIDTLEDSRLISSSGRIEFAFERS